jgi:23S rRNA pseudouridine2605 synthase
MSDDKDDNSGGERIAKRMARAGLCSRRDAERWIAEGRVMVNGRKLDTPACVVTDADVILVNGKPLAGAAKTQLWLYHKPRGLMTTHRDPQGRPTVFDNLPTGLPRVISVGRLDFNSEGLLLLTNDGELARKLELPTTGWVRRYRVRVNGVVEQRHLDQLAKGIEVEGVRYGKIEAVLDRNQGDNSWITMALTEGKNREIRKICGHFGWPVSRLIRVAFGPFQIGHLEKGDIEEVPGKVLREQLGQAGKPQRDDDKRLTGKRVAHEMKGQLRLKPGAPRGDHAGSKSDSARRDRTSRPFGRSSGKAGRPR